VPVSSQYPHNLSTHADLIQSCDIYDCFGGNTVEVEIMLEYVDKRKLTPRHIYRDVSADFLSVHIYSYFFRSSNMFSSNQEVFNLSLNSIYLKKSMPSLRQEMWP